MYVFVYQYIVLKGKPAYCKLYFCFHYHYLDEDKLLQDSYISQPVMLPDGTLETLGKKKNKCGRKSIQNCFQMFLKFTIIIHT